MKQGIRYSAREALSKAVKSQKRDHPEPRPGANTGCMSFTGSSQASFRPTKCLQRKSTQEPFQYEVPTGILLGHRSSIYLFNLTMHTCRTRSLSTSQSLSSRDTLQPRPKSVAPTPLAVLVGGRSGWTSTGNLLSVTGCSPTYYAIHE